MKNGTRAGIAGIGKTLLTKLGAFMLFFFMGLLFSATAGAVVGAIFYAVRDKELIDAICRNSYLSYSAADYFLKFSLGLGFIGFAVAAALTRKAFLGGIGAAFLPLVAAVLLCSLLLSLGEFTGCETQCIYSPLIDTRHSENFNPYNVPKLKAGMSRAEIADLVGEPLWEDGGHMRFTEDGACAFGDFAWYVLDVYMEDGKAVKIHSDWMDD